MPNSGFIATSDLVLLRLEMCPPEGWPTIALKQLPNPGSRLKLKLLINPKLLKKKS